MNRKNQSDYIQEDPYDIIRKLRQVIEEQKDQLEEYSIACDSLIFEKTAAVKEAIDLKKEVFYITQKLQQEKLDKSQANTLTQSNLFQTRVFSKQNRLNFAALSPQLTKKDIANSQVINYSSPLETRKSIKSKEFVPTDIVFNSKESSRGLKKYSFVQQSSSQNVIQNVGQYLIQDFVVISPDILELKKLRESHKEQKSLKLSEYYFFNFNNAYKNRKGEYLREVAKRVFPIGAMARRKTIQSLEQFQKQIQYEVSSRMGEQYFIFNLKGDVAASQNSIKYVETTNPFQALFAVCLRVPEFIPIRDEKALQKKEQQVWMVEKVYTILTYYPFFNVHLATLAKIAKTLQPQWYKLQKDQILSKNLQRNLTQAQQNLDINKLIAFLQSKKPQPGQSVVHNNEYLGTLPLSGFNQQYCIARFTCGIFFSIFAYQEMLLLLTALFLEKTIIFVSKSDSAATLCALFLTTVIAPFKYNQHLILNCDSQKIADIVFEFPFTLIASLKKDESFPNILRMFIDGNFDRFKGFNAKEQSAPLMLVDIDSNSIFYDPLLNNDFEKLIVSPSDQLRDAYLQVNSANSKSFSLPKKMPVEMMAKPRNPYQKHEQERRRLLKQYHQKIYNNTSKWPLYNPSEAHFRVLALLTDYIQSFGINHDYQYQLIVSHRLNKEARKEAARRHLYGKHPFRYKFVDCLVESQLYADYLDQIEKQIQI